MGPSQFSAISTQSLLLPAYPRQHSAAGRRNTRKTLQSLLCLQRGAAARSLVLATIGGPPTVQDSPNSGYLTHPITLMINPIDMSLRTSISLAVRAIAA